MAAGPSSIYRYRSGFAYEVEYVGHNWGEESKDKVVSSFNAPALE